ncbi:MAG: TlpA family protein disulfide reductase [Acidobacteria bacterium]|nr:TlpA family protein disulfide reductase [Acidobacteriota bacterium]
MRRLLIVLACVSLSISCKGFPQTPSGFVHKSAPQFVRTDLSGRKIDLKSYRGKVVLLNFWATWCASCQVELPRFAEWQKKYGPQGLQVLTVSMDDGDAPVRKAVRRLRLGLPVVMGDARLGEAYGGVLGLPVTFLIGRDGFITAEVEGETNLNALESHVASLLGR